MQTLLLHRNSHDVEAQVLPFSEKYCLLGNRSFEPPTLAQLTLRRRRRHVRKRGDVDGAYSINGLKHVKQGFSITLKCI